MTRPRRVFDASRLSVKTIEDIFESRRQIRAGKTIFLERLMTEE